jgi:hypothetical protein
MQTSENVWLTRKEVAARLRMKEQGLANWASLNQGPPLRKFGGHCRYLLADVIAWENAQMIRGDVENAQMIRGDADQRTDDPLGAAAG